MRIKGWIEQGIEPWRTEGFLDYWRESRSPLRGAFGEIVDTEEFENSGKCIEDVVEAMENSGKK